MILKKQEKNNLVQAIYESSNICASTYNNQTKDLVIVFNNGGQYKYTNVSETDYTRFEIADSQGAIFNSHIKKYNFEKLDKINVASIIKEVNELKDADKQIKVNHYTEEMIEKMKAVIQYYETTNSVDPILHTKLKSSMDDYEKITTSVGASVVTD
jgi:hypothetical protein